MIFNYLLPPVDLVGRQVQLPVTERDALTWLAIHRHADDGQRFACSKRLLADCPELLVWCLARVDPASLDESMLLEQIAEALLATDEIQMQPLNEQIAEPFADVSKRKYRKTLLRLFDPDFRHSFDIARMRRKLTRLLANSLQQSVSDVERWLESWQLDHDFWACLSLSARNDESRYVGIETLLAERQQDVTASEDFELRLQEEKLASMKQLAYGASHEINNPLANIASRAQTLMLDESDPDRCLRLAKINEQAFRAHEMIADMMLFAHPPRPDMAEADAAAIADQVIDELQPLAEAQGTCVEFQTAGV
ncbi:MAG: histidine kinase dimerization/phospho-acceptor domain-containing protein, partial [Pirellulaceae bacterium]